MKPVSSFTDKGSEPQRGGVYCPKPQQDLAVISLLPTSAGPLLPLGDSLPRGHESRRWESGPGKGQASTVLPPQPV